MEAVMQLDSVEPAIHYPFEHLPNQLKESNPTVVPPTLRYQNSCASKQLAGDNAMGPDRLNQLNEQLPILPFSLIPLTLRVLLLQDALKPHLNMLGTHALGSPCTAIRQSPCSSPNLAIRWDVIVDFNWGEM